jgi:hypothetical protein
MHFVRDAYMCVAGVRVCANKNHVYVRACARACVCVHACVRGRMFVCMPKYVHNRDSAQPTCVTPRCVRVPVGLRLVQLRVWTG